MLCNCSYEFIIKKNYADNLFFKIGAYNNDNAYAV